MRQAHSVLAEICVVYLTFLNSEDLDFPNTDSKTESEANNETESDADNETDLYINEDIFLDYSARHWATHFRETQMSSNEALILSVLKICEADSKSFSTWFDIYLEREAYLSITGPFPTIMTTSYFGHEAVVKLLLDTSKVNVNLGNMTSRTPLSWAAGNGHEAVVRLLLDTGKVDVDSKDDNGQTPLSSASENGHEAIVKLLLDTGKVDVNSEDDNGRTPLSWAAKNGHEAVVKYFLTMAKERLIQRITVVRRRYH
jgi:hypothetical protein